MTNLRKLILMALLALPLSLAVGCGDDTGNGNGNGDGDGDGDGPVTVDPRKHCRDNAEAWKLSSLAIAATYGFDLDDHVTGNDDPKTPSTGCGVPDGNPEGIDNGFAALVDVLGALNIDIDSIIAEAIAGGDVDVVAYIRGYSDGGANDNIQLTLIVNGAEIPELVDVEAELTADGKIVAELESLPLQLRDIEIPLGEEPTVLNLTINVLKVRVEIDEPGSEASTLAILGGGVQYSGTGGLRDDLIDLLDKIDLGDMEIDPDAIVGDFLDMSSDGNTCNSISLGAQVGFTYSDLCE